MADIPTNPPRLLIPTYFASFEHPPAGRETPDAWIGEDEECGRSLIADADGMYAAFPLQDGACFNFMVYRDHGDALLVIGPRAWTVTREPPEGVNDVTEVPGMEAKSLPALVRRLRRDGLSGDRRIFYKEWLPPEDYVYRAASGSFERAPAWASQVGAHSAT